MNKLITIAVLLFTITISAQKVRIDSAVVMTLDTHIKLKVVRTGDQFYKTINQLSEKLNMDAFCISAYYQDGTVLHSIIRRKEKRPKKIKEPANII